MERPLVWSGTGDNVEKGSRQKGTFSRRIPAWSCASGNGESNIPTRALAPWSDTDDNKEYIGVHIKLSNVVASHDDVKINLNIEKGSLDATFQQTDHMETGELKSNSCKVSAENQRCVKTHIWFSRKQT